MQNTDSNTASMSILPLKPDDVLKMDKTLTPILNHLNTIDLLNAYNVDRKIRLVVIDIIKDRRIEFDDLRYRISSAKVFNLFGKHMTKLQIDGSDVEKYPANGEYTAFDKFIEIIRIYGSPGKLVELEINFHYPMFSRHTEQLLHRASPFFKNVSKLICNISLTTYNDAEVERFGKIFPSNTLRSLKIDRVVTENWLYSPGLLNLQHLNISGHRPVGDSVDFKRFFQLHPNLKEFCCRKNIYIESIARFVPNIEGIGVLRNVSREQQDCFRRFNRLKKIEIAVEDNGHGLFEMLNNLPNKDMLEMLTLDLGRYSVKQNDEPIEKRLPAILEQFTNLKWLRLFNLDPGSDIFVTTFLSQLRTVTKCTIETCEVPTLLQAMQSLKNIRILITHRYVSQNTYGEIMKTWMKRQQEELFTYPIVIYSPTRYETIMNEQYLSIYDKTIVRFEQVNENEMKPFSFKWL